MTRPTSASVYSFLQEGGCDWHLPDRDLAEQLERICPGMRLAARDNREFLSRAVAWAAGLGVAQVLDLGSGYVRPGCGLGDVARNVRPGVKVAYVDNDLDAAEFTAAVTEDDPGAVAVHADLRYPAKLLADPAITKVIDLIQPVALVLGGVLHYSSPRLGARLVRGYARRLASGSVIVVTVPCYADPGMLARVRDVYSPARLYEYQPADVADCFSGLIIEPPGIGPAAGMRPGWNDLSLATPEHVYALGAIGRKA